MCDLRRVKNPVVYTYIINDAIEICRSMRSLNGDTSNYEVIYAVYTAEPFAAIGSNPHRDYFFLVVYKQLPLVRITGHYNVIVTVGLNYCRTEQPVGTSRITIVNTKFGRIRIKSYKT